MRIVYFLSALFLILISGCKTLDVPNDTPSCIRKIIKVIEAEEARNPPSRIFQYTFNGQTVYYIPPYCCDITSELYDEDCNLICRPDGGITGEGDRQCMDFFPTRTNEKLLWVDKRVKEED